ncbi:hypothetical protein [Streptomyces sp. HC307]|uniref:hypothetical protein n=1 Tax=Streptomyces flavusporus TaxID=3385496 RepID=UPI003917258B
MSTIDAAVRADVSLVAPGPDVPVVPSHRLRPGIHAEDVSASASCGGIWPTCSTRTPPQDGQLAGDRANPDESEAAG